MVNAPCAYLFTGLTYRPGTFRTGRATGGDRPIHGPTYDGAVHKYNVRRLDCGSSNTGSYEPADDGRNIFNATPSMICILIHRNVAL